MHWYVYENRFKKNYSNSQLIQNVRVVVLYFYLCYLRGLSIETGSGESPNKNSNLMDTFTDNKQNCTIIIYFKNLLNKLKCQWFKTDCSKSK